MYMWRLSIKEDLYFFENNQEGQDTLLVGQDPISNHI